MGELLKETFVSSSLWLMKRKGEVYIKSSNHSIKLPLLLCCCDVHPLPGPYIKQLESLYKHRGLKIFHQNIWGLKSSHEILSQILGSDNINILTLSDAHIIENIDFDDKNEPYKIQNYSFINHGRLKGGGRGVRIFIKREVDFERRKNLDWKISKWCVLKFL